MNKIKSFKDYNKLNQDKKYGYGCSMIYFDFPEISEIHSQIDESHLYTEDGPIPYGLETEPHTTLLYGLHSDEIDDNDVIDASLRNPIPEKIVLHNASLFQNDKFDVLKFDIKNQELHKINSELKKFPYTSDFPDYHPHSTIGYFQKGLANQYMKSLEGKIFEVNPSKIVYSKPNGDKVTKDIK